MFKNCRNILAVFFSTALLFVLGSCRTTPVNSGGGVDTTGNNDGSTTAIDGLVLKGPISPVSRQGDPNVAPLAGATISISEANTARKPTDVVSDSAGKFYLKVSAGTYLVTPNPFQNSVYPRPQSPQTVYVAAGTTIKDTLNYDTGIW